MLQGQPFLLDEPISDPCHFRDQLTPRDKELMEGMCNCYTACGDDFENTVKMVAGSRGRTPQDVKETLARLATESASEKDYRSLRSRLPAEFPF